MVLELDGMINKTFRLPTLRKKNCYFVRSKITIDIIISRVQFWITIRHYNWNTRPYYHFRYVWMRGFQRYWTFENGRSIYGTSDTTW